MVKPERSRRFSQLRTWGLKSSVIAALTAIGWWGHTQHWQLPALSSTDASPAPASNAPPTGEDEAITAKREFPEQLPKIEFSSPDAARNCGIETALAEERSMIPAIVATGTVGYDQTHCAEVSVRVPGIVWRVEKRLGDEVQAGETLMIVDAAEIGDAKSALLEAAVDHRLHSEHLKRLESIRGVVAQTEISRVAADAEVSHAKRFNAVQKLANLGFAIRLDDVSQLTVDELSEYLVRLGLPDSVAAETSSANLIPVRSPLHGIVTTSDVVQGERVDPSEPQYVIADTRHMWINLNVRQEDAVKLHVGNGVSFDWNGGAQPIDGVLTWIGTEMDQKTRTVRARADVENPSIDSADNQLCGRRLLQANVFGTVRIETGQPARAVVVPNDALHWQWEIGQEVIFVAANDRSHFEPRIVTKGRVLGELAEVITGLRAGECVVTDGSRILSSELSDHLQLHVGDNAAAVRQFDHVSEVAATNP